MALKFNEKFYHTKEWQMTREYILKRDNYLCQICGAPAEEVHHIIHLTPENVTDVSITMNPENLVSLCKDCHFAQHKQDKINGIKKKHNTNDCGDEYYFDESGMLQKVNTPPKK